jgi:hypothetical protein
VAHRHASEEGWPERTDIVCRPDHRYRHVLQKTVDENAGVRRVVAMRGAPTDDPPPRRIAARCCTTPQGAVPIASLQFARCAVVCPRPRLLRQRGAGAHRPSPQELLRTRFPRCLRPVLQDLDADFPPGPAVTLSQKSPGFLVVAINLRVSYHHTVQEMLL